MTDTEMLGGSSENPVPPAPERSSDQAKPQVFPEVELPRTGRVLADFAREMGEILRTNGVYLQDGEPVVLEPKTDRMTLLGADCFRTFAEKSLRTVKLVRVQSTVNGQSVTSYEPRWESMNRMQAQAVLTSHQFRELLRRLRRISRIPVPVIRDGKLDLHREGYDAMTKILVKN